MLLIHYYSFRTLLSSEELSQFTHVKVFLDEDFTSTEKFTVRETIHESFRDKRSGCHEQALGNLYFLHNSLEDCLIWDFVEKTFVPAIGQDIFAGDIEDVPIKEKAKFPQEFFPEVSKHEHGLVWLLKDHFTNSVNGHEKALWGPDGVYPAMSLI